MTPAIIILIIVVFVILGIIVFPIVNNHQFRKLPTGQKINILMREAKNPVYFKNVSNGKNGTLIYVKNKRKIYLFPWKLNSGNMLCTRKKLLKNWDYPEEKPEFSKEEISQALEELTKYNNKNKVKLLFDYDTKQES